MRHHGPDLKNTDEEVSILLPEDHDQHWLPDPIPASFYARTARAAGLPAVPWRRWLDAAGGWPPRPPLAIGALVVMGAIVVGLGLHLAGQRPAAAVARQQAPPSAAGTAAAPTPPTAATPLVDAPTPTPRPTTTPTPTPSATPTTTPVTFPDGPVSARRGRTATLVAQTAPRTVCAAVVGYPSAPRLPQATSSGSGRVTWSWTVGRTVPTGTWPIVVSCGSGSAGTTIVVS